MNENPDFSSLKRLVISAYKAAILQNKQKTLLKREKAHISFSTSIANLHIDEDVYFRRTRFSTSLSAA